MYILVIHTTVYTEYSVILTWVYLCNTYSCISSVLFSNTHLVHIWISCHISVIHAKFYIRNTKGSILSVLLYYTPLLPHQYTQFFAWCMAVCQDTPLAHMYADTDVPDVVHLETVAKLELQQQLAKLWANSHTFLYFLLFY